MALMGQPFQAQQKKQAPPVRDLSAVVPKATLSAMPPNAQKAASDAYRRGGSSYLRQNVTGQPWENEVKQALAAGAGAAQNGLTGMRPASSSGSGASNPYVPPAGAASDVVPSPQVSPGPAQGGGSGQPGAPPQTPGPAPGGGSGQPGAPPQAPAATGWQGVGNILNRIDPNAKARLMEQMQQIPAGGGARYRFMLEQLRQMGAPGVNFLPDQGNQAFDWYAWNSSSGQPGGQTDPPEPVPQIGPNPRIFPNTSPAPPTPPIIDPSQIPGGVGGGGGTVDPAILKNIIGNPGGGFISPF